MPVIKYDNFKSRLDLLPVDALELVGFVLRHGARKYRANGWQDCEDPQRYIRPILTHTFQHLKGNYTDPESGILHLAHAVTSGLIALELFIKLSQSSKMEPGRFNYFAIIERKSKRRGIVKKRFRSYEKAWKYLIDNELEPSQHIIQTIKPADKIGATVPM